MAARPTQRDRLLRILRDAGSAGVHTHELRHEGFGNPSQRVRELAELGHTIECKRERRNDSPGTRYTLKTAGGGASSSSEDQADRDQGTPSALQVAAPPAVHDEAVSLFGADPGIEVGGTVTNAPGPNAYDPFCEAA